MPRFIIQHVTRYTYESPVTDSTNAILLYPLKDELQELVHQQLNITGEPNIDVHTDYYGNRVGAFMNIAPHYELKIDSKVEVITRPRIFPEDTESAAEQWAALKQLHNNVSFIDFLRQENFPALAEVKAIADAGFYEAVSVYVAVLQLTEYVYKNFKYIQGITSIETTVDEIWKLKAGVCQDFAHILLVMLRLLCIPARYVSGYVCPKNEGMRGEGATHAWVEAYLPFYGWLGFDPTNNCIVNELHVRLAIGRNFSDCSPVRGTYKGTAKQTLEVGVSVVYEDGERSKSLNAVMKPQPVLSNPVDENINSYRRHMEMMQQQQQQ
ncbi:MAG: transglutaminase family protein [Ferruginibacter sp.]